jgi:hypothetical protein
MIWVLIVEIYSEMTEAIKTGKPYRSRLDPSPGPPTDGQGNFLLLSEWKPGQPKPSNWHRTFITKRGYMSNNDWNKEDEGTEDHWYLGGLCRLNELIQEVYYVK